MPTPLIADTLALIALAQSATPQSTTTPPASASLVSTVWDLTLKGGIVMIPIALCSLVAVTLIVERLLSLRPSRVMPPAFLAGVRPALARGHASAAEFCRANPSPLSRILEAGLRRWDRPIEQVEKHIGEAGLRETTLLRKNFRGLVVITAVAPLLGLLGTIFGMITAFRTVAASADSLGRTELLASGIYEAMVTTAAGLIVAIPTLLAYHALAAKVDRLVFDMDAACIDLVEAHDGRVADPAPVVTESKRDSTPAHLVKPVERAAHDLNVVETAEHEAPAAA